LEETVRLWLRNGRRLREQLETLNQLQLEQLLQRKQQLTAQRAKPKTEPPDASP
jgi:hypothetical protein